MFTWNNSRKHYIYCKKIQKVKHKTHHYEKIKKLAKFINCLSRRNCDLFGWSWIFQSDSIGKFSKRSYFVVWMCGHLHMLIDLVCSRDRVLYTSTSIQAGKRSPYWDSDFFNHCTNSCSQMVYSSWHCYSNYNYATCPGMDKALRSVRVFFL